ncbi:MAG: hypothetical protein HWE27_08985 [Gammaproteobacteria bacterium]|nr:hypothetical protein [Gammaproteobacteria bacterium]
MYKSLVIAAVVAITAGCSSVGDGTQVASLSDSDLVCKKVKKTGTNIPTRMCASKEEWDRQAEEAQAEMQRMQTKTMGQ